MSALQGGCGSAGDWVGDTPPQAAGYPECKARVSCGASEPWEGKLNYKDLVHNVMPYGSDSCLKSLTPQQTNRYGSRP